MKQFMNLLFSVIILMIGLIPNLKAQCTITVTNKTLPLCSGTGVIDLKATASVSGCTFKWVAPNGQQVSSTSEVYMVAPTSEMSGTFRVFATGPGCTANNVATVIVYGSATAPSGISIANNSTCAGTNKTLTPIGGSKGDNPGSVYKWYSNAGCTSLLYTGDSYTVNPSVNTQYWVRITGGCNTTATATGTVTVAQIGTPSIPVASGSICQGGTTIFTTYATNATGYKWMITPQSAGGFVDNTTGVASWSSSYSGTATVSVYATGCGNSATVPTTVTVNSLPPNPTAPPTQSVCGTVTTSSLSLNPSSGCNCNVNWFDTNGTLVSSSTNLSNGSTYYAKYKENNSSCLSAGSAPVTVTIHSLPTAPTGISVSNSNTCPGTLKILTPTGGSKGTHPNAVYKWYSNSSCTALLYTGDSYSVDPLDNTQYWARIEGGCPTTAVATATVTVRKIGTPSQPSYTGPICQGGTTLFTANAANATGYEWMVNSAGVGGLTDNTSGLVYWSSAYSGPATVSVRATGCGPASGWVDLPINVNPLPSPLPQVSALYVIPYNTPGTLTATGAGYGEGYHWYTNLSGGDALTSNLTPTLTSNAIYYVTKYNASGCESSPRVKFPIVVNKYPVSDAGVDMTITLPDNRVVLSGSASDPDGTIESYEWIQTSGPTTSINNSKSLAAYTDALTTGTYIFRLTVSDNYKFAVSDDVKVTVNPCPSGFNYNYIKETTVQEADKTDMALLTGLPVEKRTIIYSYFDGLGRPMQTVSWQASPNKNDIVQPIAYDEYGREPIKYLPYISSSNGGSYKLSSLTDQASFYTGTMGFSSDDSAYSRTVFEPSPLNRVMQQGAPGAVWQPSAGHALSIAYLTNTATEVKQWSVNSTNQCVLRSTNSGNYDAGSLYVNQTRDENGNRTREYKDKEGRVVLKKSYIEDDSLQTYYVYDDFGLLRYVIPPKAVKVINMTSFNSTHAYVRQLCYYYRYDERNRMVVKQLPGVDSVLMVYDGRDRLTASQDGNQRKTGEWLFTKYDAFNRPVMTGAFKPAETTREALQTAVNTYYNSSGVNWYTERSSQSTLTNATGYYLTRSYPESVTESNVRSLTYYDNYDTIPGLKKFVAVSELKDSVQNPKVKGQVTATRVKVLDGGNNWITTSIYYDDKYRVIQTVKNNYINGDDRLTTRYDFVGKIKQTRLVHTGLTGKRVDKTFEYDHAGRLVKIFHSVDGTTPVLMSYMKYNELGQLVDKKLHVTDKDNYNTYVQSIDYRYNIRGWLNSINNPGLTNDSGTTNDDTTDKFGMKLMYNN